MGQLLFTYNRDTHEITLHSTKKLKEGDEVEIPRIYSGHKGIFDYIQPRNFLIIKVLENRDCKGKFNNPKDGKDSFYRLATRVK